MRLKSLLLLIILTFITLQLYPQQNHKRIPKTNSIEPDIIGNNNYPVSNSFIDRPIVLEGEKFGSDYIIGPEIEITGLSGFYDYQTNGDCKHSINRYNSSVMHATFMTALDSFNINTSRRSRYAFSDNDGATWTFLGDVPQIRSGFPSLTTKADGSAIIGEHYNLSTYLRGVLNVDLVPGAGAFSAYGTGVTNGLNGCWPGVSRLTNGNILVVGETYQAGASTDTGYVQIFNPVTNTFGPFLRFYNNAGADQTQMRSTYAAGPNGKALFVINAIDDMGGSIGLNRMFITTTTNNGVSWSAPSLLFDSHVIGSEIISPYISIDAIYDTSGNYYIAFNTTDEIREYATSKLWVLKNGTAISLVAEHSGYNGIPESLIEAIIPQTGMVGIDHPSLAISSDGTTIFVGYSVVYQNDSLEGYNKCHVYFSSAPLSTMNFNSPVKITNSGPNSFDERYMSINQVAPTISGQGITLYVSYQKDPQPGSCAFNDGAPVSRSKMIFRKITFADITGSHSETNINEKYDLEQNFPNPFNPETSIKFTLQKKGFVTLKVYDILGNEIKSLLNDNLNAGFHEIKWNAVNFPSGIYFYTIKADEFTQTHKMILLK